MPAALLTYFRQYLLDLKAIRSIGELPPVTSFNGVLEPSTNLAYYRQYLGRI